MIGAVAIGPAGRNPAPLLAEAEAGVRAAAAAGAMLVVLPELFADPYVAGDAPSLWPASAATEGRALGIWAAGLARELDVAILYGATLAEAEGKPFNAAFLARPGGAVEVVARKIHLPPPAPGEDFGEADHFEEGPAEIGTFPLGPLRIAALVCYDRRFPECWRAAAAAGADVVAVLIAGAAPDDPPGYCLSELATNTRSNAVYSLAAARYGRETATVLPLVHTGVTAAIDPNGGVLDIVPASSPGLVLARIDPARLAAARVANPTAARLRLVRRAPTIADQRKPQEE